MESRCRQRAPRGFRFFWLNSNSNKFDSKVRSKRRVDMSLERKLISALLAITTLAASSNAQVSATRYEVVDIGALTAMPYSLGISVSNSGFVAGIASNGTNFEQGFNWREGRGVQWLTHP